MKHTITSPTQVGLLQLDSTDTVKSVAAAIEARRAQCIEADMGMMRRDRRGLVIPGSGKWPTLGRVTFSDPTKPRYRAPKPGDGIPKFDTRTEQAMDACERDGAEFWAFHPVNRTCWAVKIASTSL